MNLVPGAPEMIQMPSSIAEQFRSAPLHAAPPQSHDPSDVDHGLQTLAPRGSAPQEALVRECYDHVHQLARSLSATDEDAEDLTQQVLLELLYLLPSYRGETSLERWVARATFHCARGADRKERYRHQLRERWLVPGRTPWGVETEVTARDPLDLYDALGKLPEERRRMVLLRHALGYTVNEISGLTRTPRGTVKDRLVAGKKQLMRSLRAELLDRGWLSGSSDSTRVAFDDGPVESSRLLKKQPAR
jgi:RNA polymerase sigma-70 factor (ECF subfamily)